VVQQLGPGQWSVDGTADLHYLEQVLETNALVGDTDDYTSLAGLMLERFGTLPQVGDMLEIAGFRFEVAAVLERRIATVLVSRIEDDAAGYPEQA